MPFRMYHAENRERIAKRARINNEAVKAAKRRRVALVASLPGVGDPTDHADGMTVPGMQAHLLAHHGVDAYDCDERSALARLHRSVHAAEDQGVTL